MNVLVITMTKKQQIDQAGKSSSLRAETRVSDKRFLIISRVRQQTHAFCIHISGHSSSPIVFLSSSQPPTTHSSPSTLSYWFPIFDANKLIVVMSRRVQRQTYPLTTIS